MSVVPTPEQEAEAAARRKQLRDACKGLGELEERGSWPNGDGWTNYELVQAEVHAAVVIQAAEALRRLARELGE